MYICIFKYEYIFTWLIEMCDMTLERVRRKSFILVT